jgi:RNA polymerase sigma-70 factor (ECF subfamily)
MPVMQSSLHTTQLLLFCRRIRAGETEAMGQLLELIWDRAERLSRKLLHRDFPRLRRWKDTDDIHQESMIRLEAALKVVEPGSEKALFGLVGEEILRVCHDWARKYFGANGLGTCHASDPPQQAGNRTPDKLPPLDPAALHEAVERLPPEELEVVLLRYYHGCKHVEAAEILGVDERTVRRRLEKALARLHDLLGGEWPAA